MKRTPIRDIVWLFILTRLVLLLVAYFGYIFLTAEQYSSAPVDAAFFTAWNHGDAIRYLHIAQYGYQSQLDTGFFPLFPLLIAAIAHLFGTWSYPLVGMLISNAALSGALFLLYQLAVDSGGEQVAQRTLLYLCIFPTAFFFFTAYNESLFLFLTSGTFLAVRRQRWWLAGLFGFFTALTRSTGILLVLPYLYELWVAREGLLSNHRKLLPSLLPLLLIPSGLVLYSFYCWLLTGDPLSFVTAQRYFSWPWQGLVEAFWNQPFGTFYQVNVLLNLSATLGFIALTILGWRKLRTSYSLWNIVLLLSVLLSASVTQHEALASNQRVVLELFPAFMTLGFLSIDSPKLHQALQLLFLALLATLSLLFVMNRWMV